MTRGETCQGVALIMFSNVVYILNNYLVSWFQLASAEVALARGILQVPFSASLILLRNRRLLGEVCISHLKSSL